MNFELGGRQTRKFAVHLDECPFRGNYPEFSRAVGLDFPMLFEGAAVQSTQITDYLPTVHVPHDHDVEQAVVRLGLGRCLHASTEVLTVGHDD